MSQTTYLKLNGTKTTDVKQAHVIKTVTQDGQGNTLKWVVRSFEVPQKDDLFENDRNELINAYLPDLEKQSVPSLFSSAENQLMSYDPRFLLEENRAYGWLNETAHRVFHESEKGTGMFSRFFTSAGVAAHYCMGVFLAVRAEALGIIVKTNLPKNEDGKVDLFHDCTLVAVRFLRFYSWMGVDAEGLINEAVTEILDRKRLFATLPTMITIEPEGKEGDFTFHWPGQGARKIELKTFHYRKHKDAVAVLRSCNSVYSVVFIGLRKVGDSGLSATVGSWTTTTKEFDRTTGFTPAKCVVSKIPMFTVFEHVRHVSRKANPIVTFEGRLIHACMAWMIMTPQEMNVSSMNVRSKSRTNQKDATFIAERNRLVVPLTGIFIGPLADKGYVTNLGNRIREFVKDIYRGIGVSFVLELKTRWTDSKAGITGSLRQERADFIIGNNEDIQVTVQLQIFMPTFGRFAKGTRKTEEFKIRVEKSNPFDESRAGGPFKVVTEENADYDAGQDQERITIKDGDKDCFSFKNDTDVTKVVEKIREFVLGPGRAPSVRVRVLNFPSRVVNQISSYRGVGKRVKEGPV